MSRRTKTRGKPKTVMVVCTYPFDTAPGQRFRFEQYLSILKDNGIQLTMFPFWDDRSYKILYGSGNSVRKAIGLVKGFARRAAQITKLRQFDYVLLFREATPIGPPWFETLLFKLNTNVIYDFDDAIFIQMPSLVGSRVVDALKWNSKVAYLTRKAYRVSVCNPFLARWASQYNASTLVLPTTVGPEYFTHRKQHSMQERPVIGWSGSHSTIAYLETVRPVLKQLQEHYDFELVVICNRDPGFPDMRHYRFVPWNSATEVKDLLQLNVGLMPVAEEAFARGKVGLKAIQYSALGIIPVVSGWGSGPEVVVDGTTGYVVHGSESAWYEVLAHVLDQRARWNEIGARAGEYVRTRYSVEAQAPRYVELFGGRIDMYRRCTDAHSIEGESIRVA